ncbi:class I SAM-dependent methyltransferase [Aquamicrobium lusatiense]|uniref:class I SAM-dependent methyltransferase n=1 Tax=Aquamicrobium lusatiense TaxID=89772 RepID=UPI002456D98A|nr:class I SAM-dependent methyltransferase [Aquamicrobium lusatiense]MDH4993076.1 class I SAM-dependent methyltransferase [Aquamicrobium lusatiense]
MTQNIYDRPDFFQGYSALPRSVLGLGGAPEWPAILELLPELEQKHVIDLGCGLGWFCRWAAEKGAAQVLGLDLSQNMLERARAETSNPTIRYQRADLSALDLPARVFDLAYSSLAFHYVEDFPRLAKTIHAALAPGGDLVFSIEHPIFMTSQHAVWIANANGERCWPVDHYAEEGQRRTDWLAEGVIKYHRRLATTINTLIDTGFSLRRLVEWAPDTAQLQALPELADEIHRPMIAIIAATR